MEDIFKILADNGVEVPDDKKDDLRKKIAKNYKSITEFNDKIKEANDAREEAENTLNEYKEAAEKSNGDLSKANEIIENYKKADEEREQKQKEAEANAKLKDRFVKVKPEDKQFFNEATENWLFEEFKKALNDEANADKSDADVYNSISKDKDIYKAKNEFRTPGSNKQTHQTSDDAFLAEKYKNNPFFHN